MEENTHIKQSKEWIEFNNYYMSYNIFDQLDFFRLEDIHTNILKSLFIKDNPYSLDTYPLKKLLELLIVKDNTKVAINIEELNNCKIENINVHSQVVLNKNNKLDLLIEFTINNKNYSIILENKLLSTEHDNQCQRYYNYYKEESKDINYIFVFLSLEKEPNFKEDDKYICINYQELIDYVIEPCSYKCNNKKENIISLDSYLSSFSKLFNFIGLSNEDIIIPITKLGKELTHSLKQKYGNFLIDALKTNNEFYKENKNILLIYYYNLYKISDNNETKNLIKKEILKIKCTFNGINCSFKQCSLKIIEYLFNKKIIKNNNDLIKLNNCLLNKNYLIATKNIEGIKHKECYTNNAKTIGKILLNNNELYYYNGNVNYDELKYFVININKEFNNILDDIVEIY